MSTVLTNGSVFVDVGANIGYYSRLARSLVGNSGEVHAFEPLPCALNLLKLNACGWSGNNQVKVYPFAVGDIEGEVDFFEQPNGDTSSLASDSLAKRISVQIVTLDSQLASLNRLDLLKIDVEGYELEVLLGGINLIKKHQPVIEFEFLDGYSRKRGLTLENYKEVLEPLGYQFYWSNHSSKGSILVADHPTSDIVAVPQSWHSRLNPSINNMPT